jgi:hypothetical protein
MLEYYLEKYLPKGVNVNLSVGITPSLRQLRSFVFACGCSPTIYA